MGKQNIQAKEVYRKANNQNIVNMFLDFLFNVFKMFRIRINCRGT